MKYYKRLNHGNATIKQPWEIGVIYPEDNKPSSIFNNTSTSVNMYPDRWEEVSEREYWQQELDAGKLIKGGYYTVIKYGNIFKHSGNPEAEYYTGDSCTTFSRNGGNFDSNNETKDYRLATDDEIEWLEACNKADRFITKEEFMKSKEFVLPEKWFVKVTNENRDILNDWRSKQPYVNMDIPLQTKLTSDKWNDNSYCSYIYSKTLKDYQEITFEQFQKYVLGIKENNMNDKKIIGYKLIKPEYKEAVNKICDVYEFDFPRFENNADSILGGLQKLKNAGVLDLWFEEVYEPEYKVGDWVLLSNTANGWGAYPEEVNNKILQITKIDLEDNSEKGGRYYFGKGVKIIGKEIVRKATPQEIEEATKPKIIIKGYEAQFTDNSVSFGCQTYDKDFVLQLDKFLDDSGLVLDYGKEVMQVANYFKNK